MKGKRKAKASKWAMKFQFEAEAQRLMFARSEKASNRFLDAALHLGSAQEPLGKLAGTPSSPHSKSPDLPALLSSVINTVCKAGQLLVTEWQRADGPRGQRDKTVVDVEIEQLLRQQLRNLFFCDLWGEETGHTLTGDSWCWVVDPNDGTNDFLRGLKGSAISVGLLHTHPPVLGVVYAPVTIEGVPDCIAWAEGLSNALRDA